MKQGRQPIRIEGDRFLRRNRNLRVRRRRRWRWFTRRSGWILFFGLLAGGGSVLLAQAGSLLTNSGLFEVRRFTFQNRQRAPIQELSRMAQPVASGSLFHVDLVAVQERLETHRWIRRVHVRRRLPDTLHISLQERKPEALARIHDRLFLIDAEGMPIEPYETERVPGHYPVLAGLPQKEGASRDRALRRGTRLLGKLRERHPDLLSRIDRVDLRSPDRIDLYLKEEPAPLRLPPQGSLGTLPSYLKIRDRIHHRVPAPARIDLRWDGQIAVAVRRGRH